MVRGKIDALACNSELRLRFPIFSFRSCLVVLALLLGALLVVPAAASAGSYVVNEEFSGIPPEFSCNSGPQEECTLTEAIDLANEAGAGSTITFAPSLELIFAEGELPAIQSGITIDGTGSDGDPGVEISGDTEGSPYNRAFEIKAPEVTIEGLSLVHFRQPIVVEDELAAICGNSIGVELDGETADPNFIGIELTPTAVETSIGTDCAGGGNVISGNEWVGILDRGEETHIAGNVIGASASGASLPNGESPQPSEPAGGIIAAGIRTLIGGPGLDEGNLIAHNVSVPSTFGDFGGGIVDRRASVSIRGNSIFGNDGPGIYVDYLNPLPPPVVESAASVEAVSTVVNGSVSAAAPGEAVSVDVFANDACDKYESGLAEFTEAGEGERYIGTASVKADGLGIAKFEVTAPVQAAGTMLTAVANGQTSGSSSEFSACLIAPKPSPKPPKPPPPGPEPEKEAPKPENGETVAVAPKAGSVYVRAPGKKKKKLKEGETIPVGSIVDATQGKVTLTSINKAGEEQTAVFYGGVFLVTQHDGSGLVILKLRGGDFSSCKNGSAGSSSLARAGRKSRHLWGSGHGKFRTEGNYGSASVRGTIWLTEDRCDGTFFKVKRGVVTVRDFTLSKTLALPKGKTYLAQP